MIRFHVDEELCIQCGECEVECPAGVITLEEFPEITDEQGCFQCQHCLAVCPTAAVSILGRNPDESVVLAGNMPDPARLATLIKGRRSVRRYKQEDLPPELIDELLEIACHAPTGVNARSVLFTVVKQRTVMNTLRAEVMARLAHLKDSGQLPEGFLGQYLGRAVQAWQEAGKDIIFRGAPHLLVTSAPQDAPCPVQDTHIALTTFQLMAHARGVGTVWDGLFMMVVSLCPDLVGRLGIPANHTLGFSMAFGAPAVEYHRTVQRGPALVNVVK